MPPGRIDDLFFFSEGNRKFNRAKKIFRNLILGIFENVKVKNVGSCWELKFEVF